MSYLVGVDVGGTKRAAIILDASGATVAHHWTDHGHDREGRLREIVHDAIRDVLAEAGVSNEDVAAFGVAVAGLVSNDRSTVVRAPVLGERQLELGRGLAAVLGRPVVVVNDANATLRAHIARSKPDRSASHPGSDETRITLLLTLGTGVGGAIMVGERMIVGHRGFAAELGHLTVDHDDPRTCKCGSRGCVEQFASGRGIAELAASVPPPSASRATLDALGLRPPYSTQDVTRAALEGDPWATGLLVQAGTMLGRAITDLCVVLDPESVVIGGTLGHATGSWLIPAALEEMRRRWPYAEEREPPVLALDAVGPYAAAIGAALLAAECREVER